MKANYERIKDYYESIPQEKKNNAVRNGLFIICNERLPKYPFVNIAVFAPLADEGERFIALFRNEADAIIFVKGKEFQNIV